MSWIRERRKDESCRAAGYDGSQDKPDERRHRWRGMVAALIPVPATHRVRPSPACRAVPSGLPVLPGPHPVANLVHRSRPIAIGQWSEGRSSVSKVVSLNDPASFLALAASFITRKSMNSVWRRNQLPSCALICGQGAVLGQISAALEDAPKFKGMDPGAMNDMNRLQAFASLPARRDHDARQGPE